MSLEILFLLFIIFTTFVLYFLLVISIFFSPTSIKSIINGAPLVPTPKKEIKAALKAAEVAEGDLLYDLGSGTGRVILIGKRDFKAEAVGFEYSLFWFLFSKVNLWLKNVKANIHKKNFLKADISDADIVYIYGSKKLMENLEDKLSNNTKIISYCFSFPNKKAKKVVTSPQGKNIFIYENRSN
ncbi:MAG: hypothetical protein ACQEP3_00960 [Patescibacteria group bacterium]